MITVGVLRAILELRDSMTPALERAANSAVNQGKRVAKAAAAMTLAAGVAFGVFSAKAAEAASRAEETQNLFDVSFGDMASSAEEWAQRTQAAIGVNDTTLKAFSGTLFNMVTSMGVAREGAFGLATGFTQLALDTSSFFNIPFEQAFDKIRSGLSGESEPLKQLGVLVNDTTIKQTAYAQSILATQKNLSESQKVQARAIAIMEGLQNAQGDLIRTQDSWANQTRLVGESWTDLLEEIGAVITQSPVISGVIAVINDALTGTTGSLKENKDEWVALVEDGLARVVDGIAAVLDSFGELGGFLTRFGDLIERASPNNEIFNDAAADFKAWGGAIEGAGTRLGELADELRGVTEQAEDPNLQQFSDDFELLSGQVGITGERAEETADKVSGLAGEANKASAVTDTYAKLNEVLSGNIATVGVESEKTARKIKLAAIEVANMQARFGEFRVGNIQDVVDTGPDRFKSFMRVPPTAQMGEFVDTIDEAETAQLEYNAALAAANDLAQLLRVTFGSIVGQSLAAVSSLQNLFSSGDGLLGGLKSSFAEGSGGSGGIIGVLGGLGSVISTAAPIIGIGLSMGKAIFSGLKSWFGRNGEDAMEEITRDLGATVSKELADQIAENGRPVQLAIADIFKEGGFDSIDRFAEEVGDLFAGFMREDFSLEELVATLNESVPLLTENIGEMGARGVEELERLFAAAAATGTQFEGMDELAAAYVERARELGIAINDVALETLGLGDALDKAFAPDTMEDIQEQFELTAEQVRALAEAAGVELQTNLERAAAQAGLSVEAFQKLQAALSEELGRNVELDEVGALLEALGADAAALAESLGVDLGENAAGELPDTLANANDELMKGVEFSAQIADNLARAAAASGGIAIPGGDVPTVPMADGGFGEVSRPTTFMAGEQGREGFAFFPGGFPSGGTGGNGGGRVEISIAHDVKVEGNVADPQRTARDLRDSFNIAFRDGLLTTEAKRALGLS